MAKTGIKFNDPTIAEFVNRPGFEALANTTLYSTALTVAAAMPPRTAFFVDRLGQNATTLIDTNMQGAGQMPHPERFLITSINLIFELLDAPMTAAIVENMRQVIQLVRTAGILQMSVNGGNEVLTVGCWGVPQINPPQMSGVHETLVAGTMVEGYTASGSGYNAYPFLYPLESKVGFEVAILAPGVATAFSLAMRWGVALNGVRFRSKQR